MTIMKIWTMKTNLKIIPRIKGGGKELIKMTNQKKVPIISKRTTKLKKKNLKKSFKSFKKSNQLKCLNGRISQRKITNHADALLPRSQHRKHNHGQRVKARCWPAICATAGITWSARDGWVKRINVKSIQSKTMII